MYWHENITPDPYEEYREPPRGCFRDILAWVIGITLAALLIYLNK